MSSPTTGVDFIFALWASEFAVFGTTDASGVVTFSDLGAGEFRLIEETDNLDFALGNSFLHCNGEPLSPDAPEPRQVALTPVDATAYGLTLSSGEEITCTWFNIPVASGDAPTPAPTQTPSTPVKQLPSTGTGTTDIPGTDDLPAISATIAALSLITAGTVYTTRRKA